MSTTVKRVATHGRNGNGAARCIDARIPFTTAGALRGNFWRAGNPLGQLPDQYRAEFSAAVKAHGLRLFVVYSYSTPIAWITPDGTVTRPEVRYSVTTSRHQGMCPRSSQL